MLRQGASMVDSLPAHWAKGRHVAMRTGSDGRYTLRTRNYYNWGSWWTWNVQDEAQVMSWPISGPPKFGSITQDWRCEWAHFTASKSVTRLTVLQVEVCCGSWTNSATCMWSAAA